jgi:hypothetical protein
MSTSIPELVALLYRADWTRLSLSATVASSRDPAVDRRLGQRKMSELRQILGPLPKFGRISGWDLHDADADADDSPRRCERSVLLAPGGRYRVSARDGRLVSVSDGDDSWEIDDGAADRQPAAGPDRLLRGLVMPQWLLACYELAITGNEVAGGRSAIRVLGTPRPVRQGRRSGLWYLLDRVEVLVDAELGILLRSEQIFEGLTREVAELRDLVIHPPEGFDHGLFTLPPGMPVTDDRWADDCQPSGPGWQVAGTAASLTASAMGFAIRHAPRRQATWPPGDDGEPDMPRGARLSADEWLPGQPPSDADVNLLHRTGLPVQVLAAELHQWVDSKAMMLRLDALKRTMPPILDGLTGPDALWDAVGERIGDYGGHRVAQLRVRMPDLYRIDYLSGDWSKKFTSISCDGESATKLFSDRVATGPAQRLDADLAAVLDPAWLLSGWRVLGISSVTLSGRPGLRLLAEVTELADGNTANIFTRAEAIVDGELGILLRLTTYAGDRPATRTELRKLTAGGDDAGFRIEPAPGMRIVTASGGPLGDRNLPRAAEAAGTAASLAVGGAIAGAIAVTGWLEKHRARRQEH